MKRDLRTNIVVLLICFVGVICPNAKAHAVTGAEAQAAAEKYWSAVLTKCGDSYYHSESRSIEQYKQVSFRVDSAKLTEADRLNGMTWNGVASMIAHVLRKINLDDRGNWQLLKWEDAFSIGRQDDVVRSVWLQKVNGRWQFMEPDSLGVPPINGRWAGLDRAAGDKLPCAYISEIEQPDARESQRSTKAEEAAAQGGLGQVGTSYGGSPYKVGGSVSAPIPICRPDPDFTEQARRDKYQGVCVISVIVDAQGLPRDPRVVKGLGEGLNEKALQAVSKWKFRPAIKDGKTPVPVMIVITLNFRLE